jgi:hypothetical protein
LTNMIRLKNAAKATEAGMRRPSRASDRESEFGINLSNTRCHLFVRVEYVKAKADRHRHQLAFVKGRQVALQLATRYRASDFQLFLGPNALIFSIHPLAAPSRLEAT